MMLLLLLLGLAHTQMRSCSLLASHTLPQNHASQQDSSSMHRDTTLCLLQPCLQA
jgi:hypothetical protein